MSKLEALNLILAKMDLPRHRRVVDKHGSNLVFLRKHLHKRNTLDDETKYLISLDINQLV